MNAMDDHPLNVLKIISNFDDPSPADKVTLATICAGAALQGDCSFCITNEVNVLKICKWCIAEGEQQEIISPRIRRTTMVVSKLHTHTAHHTCIDSLTHPHTVTHGVSLDREVCRFA